jgi:hypothetical protein
MVSSLVKAKSYLAEAQSALRSTILAHQELTSQALIHEERLAHQWGHMQVQNRSAETGAQAEDAEIATAEIFAPTELELAEAALQRQRQIASALTENLYELENLDLALGLVARIVESLVTLRVDDFNVSDAVHVLAQVKKLCEELSILQKATKLMDELLSDLAISLFKDEEAEIEHSFRLLFGLLAQINDEFHLSYKESLANTVSGIGRPQLEEWVQTNQRVVRELEQFTTAQREALALWKDRTEFAYEHDNRQLAGKAWQRKEDYGSALAKIEETLVAHVEAGALAQQRLQEQQR